MKTYLPRKVQLILLSVTALFWALSMTSLAMMTLLVLITLIILFRKKKIVIGQYDGMISPVNGRVERISENVQDGLWGRDLVKIEVIISWWKEMGIFLPMDSEVKDVVVQEDEMKLSLQGVCGKNIGLQFLKCFPGGLPNIVVLPGDRGPKGASIGHLSLGGMVNIFLPGDYRTMVEAGAPLSAGKTLVACPKG